MTLIEQLKTIPDPHGKRGKRHPLWLALFVALLGTLCGYPTAYTQVRFYPSSTRGR